MSEQIEKREFRMKVTAVELKKIRKAKADMGADTHKEFVFMLIEYYLKNKGRDIL